MTTPELDFDLDDVGQNGVYFVSETTPVFDALAGAARERDMAVAHIDLGACRNKTCALAEFARTLNFPADFGQNWDALADNLRDLAWLEAAGYVLLLEHTDGLREARGRDFGTLLDILDDAAEFWSGNATAFFVFVRMADTDT